MWFEESSSRKRSSRKSPARRKTRGRSKQNSTLLYVRSGSKKAGVHPSGKKTAAVILFVAVLTGLIWLLVSGTRLLARTVYADNPDFIIKTIEVNNPTGRLKDNAIREYAGLKAGDNIFSVSLEEIHQNLESAPLIKDVKVRRSLPDTLIIEVNERSPIARLGLNARGYHLSSDVDGYVLGPSARTPFLPAITGVMRSGLRPGNLIEDPGFHDALELVDTCLTAGLDTVIKFDSINIGHPDHMDTRLEGGARVVFSRRDKEENLRKLADIIYQSKSSQKSLAMVDLTVKKNVPVTYK